MEQSILIGVARADMMAGRALCWLLLMAAGALILMTINGGGGGACVG